MIKQYDENSNWEPGDFVRFTATWCGPCRSYEPLFNKHVHNREATAYVVDVDDYPSVAGSYGVKSIPAVFVVEDDGDLRRIELDFSDA